MNAHIIKVFDDDKIKIGYKTKFSKNILNIMIMKLKNIESWKNNKEIKQSICDKILGRKIILKNIDEINGEVYADLCFIN
jgi:hypothetical protein